MKKLQKFTAAELDYTHKIISLLKTFKDMGIELEEAIDIIHVINGKEVSKESNVN